MISDIRNYIDLVRGGPYPACQEQHQLCDYIERIFDRETLRADEAQLEQYMSYQKYFPFELFEWERFCFALHNCVYRADGLLRWPELLIYVGRGAGKNGYLSYEDFCLLTPTNGVKNYHIDIFANSEDQARTSFDDVYNVLENNRSKMERHFRWTKERIENIKTGSVLRFRTANYKTKDGGRPGKVDFDEKHQYEDYKSIEVAKTGLGKKLYPRSTTISTNGEVRDGPLDHDLARGRQILNGEIPDNGFLPFICCLNDKKQAENKANWHMANPSLRYLPTLMAQMEAEYADYQAGIIGNSSFMTKRMNFPIGNRDVEVTSWENILATNREMPDLTGRPCVGGIDYAKTNDFIAAGLLFRLPEGYYWLTHTWVCRQSADWNRIKYPVEEAEEAQLLTIVDDVEINPEYVMRWLTEQGAKYSIKKMGLDNFRYALMSSGLKKLGFDAKERKNVKLVRPSDQMRIAPVLESAFLNKSIVWGDNSLMRWYTNNVKKTTSEAGNTTYGKIEGKSRKTDGFMALVAAFAVSDELEGAIPAYPALGVVTY